jgi:hypothetical protein
MSGLLRMMGARFASAAVSIEEARTAQMAIRTMPVRTGSQPLTYPDDETASVALI